MSSSLRTEIHDLGMAKKKKTLIRIYIKIDIATNVVMTTNMIITTSIIFTTNVKIATCTTIRVA